MGIDILLLHVLGREAVVRGEAAWAVRLDEDVAGAQQVEERLLVGGIVADVELDGALAAAEVLV